MKATGIKLWLDDNRPAPEGWVHARNVEAAKVRLLQGDVEELSLDFDMDTPECATCNFECGFREEGGCQKACPCHADNGRENGGDLVRWMQQWGIWPKKKPVVHSVNPHGAAEMRYLIDSSYPG